MMVGSSSRPVSHFFSTLNTCSRFTHTHASTPHLWLDHSTCSFNSHMHLWVFVCKVILCLGFVTVSSQKFKGRMYRPVILLIHEGHASRSSTLGIHFSCRWILRLHAVTSNTTGQSSTSTWCFSDSSRMLRPRFINLVPSGFSGVSMDGPTSLPPQEPVKKSYRAHMFRIGFMLAWYWSHPSPYHLC